MIDLEYMQSLHRYIIQSTKDGSIWWSNENIANMYLNSFEEFEYLLIEVESLRFILNLPFTKLPTYLYECQARPYVGGWEKAVLKWRLRTGR